jgi:hypothetical protein
MQALFSGIEFFIKSIWLQVYMPILWGVFNYLK